MDNKVKRRLTTIMASDCVDYSKHMDENEEKRQSEREAELLRQHITGNQLAVHWYEA